MEGWVKAPHAQRRRFDGRVCPADPGKFVEMVVTDDDSKSVRLFSTLPIHRPIQLQFHLHVAMWKAFGTACQAVCVLQEQAEGVVEFADW